MEASERLRLCDIQLEAIKIEKEKLAEKYENLQAADKTIRTHKQKILDGEV